MPRTKHDLKTYREGASPPLGGAKGRIAPALRRAMALRVEKNLTIGDACALAGYSESGWHLAMKRPHVAKALEDMRAAYIAKVQGKRDYLKARAYEIAEELMEKAENPQDKWKAVEFFTREASKSGPSVTVNVESPAYAYIRPGERMVDVTPSDDNRDVQSIADSSTDEGQSG